MSTYLRRVRETVRIVSLVSKSPGEELDLENTHGENYMLKGREERRRQGGEDQNLQY